MSSPALLGSQRHAALGASGSTGTNITAAGTAHTKGSYVELSASTAFDAGGILVQLGNTSGTFDFLVDIAIGAAASEQVIVSNLLHCQNSAAVEVCPVFIPIFIPVGSRIAVRCQATTASGIVVCSIQLLAYGVLSFGSLQHVESWGPNTADSGGVSVDPGAVANTKGAYSQVTAATARETKWLIVAIGNNADAARTAATWLVDIAIGAAASEQIVIPDLRLGANSTGDDMRPKFFAFPFSIPIGARVAARASCSITTAGDRLFDIAIYGVG